MKIDLTPAMERFVRDRVNAGDYDDAGQMVCEALRLIRRREGRRARKLERLRQSIREGDEALARGDYIVLADDDALDSFFARL